MCRFMDNMRLAQTEIDDLLTEVSQLEAILFDQNVGQSDEFAHDDVESRIVRSTTESETVASTRTLGTT